MQQQSNNMVMLLCPDCIWREGHTTIKEYEEGHIQQSTDATTGVFVFVPQLCTQQLTNIIAAAIKFVTGPYTQQSNAAAAIFTFAPRPHTQQSNDATMAMFIFVPRAHTQQSNNGATLALFMSWPHSYLCPTSVWPYLEN